MSVRTDVRDRLTTEWAGDPVLAGWRVVATEGALDDIRRPTVVIRQKTIGRLAQAPTGAVAVGLLVTLVSHFTDLDNAADLLDDAVPAALAYLGPRYRITGEAEAVSWGGQRLAYDIPISVIAPIV